MKTKLCRPVLVESKEPSKLRLDNNGKLTFEPHVQGLYYSGLVHTYQQLILISLDPNEEIEDGDIVCMQFNTQGDLSGEWIVDKIVTAKFDSNNKFYYTNEGDTFKNYILESDSTRTIKKVIATQEQLSPEYIQQFLENYNDVDNDVMIEMVVDENDKRNWYVDCPMGKYWEDEPIPPSKDNLYTNASYLKPKLTGRFVTIIKQGDRQSQL